MSQPLAPIALAPWVLAGAACGGGKAGGGEADAGTERPGDAGAEAEAQDRGESEAEGEGESEPASESEAESEAESEREPGCPKDMVLVEAGPFRMGCNQPEDSACWLDEFPLHEVDVPAFCIDRTEVTVDAYRRCVDAAACSEPDTGYLFNWDVPVREAHPVNGVDWFQAGEYCRSRERRLPSEAEWEKAARGTDGRVYPWGNAHPDCSQAVFYDCGGSEGTAAAGERPTGASPYGALDMAGNVWEWVADHWHPDYQGAPDDGTAWVEPPAGSHRVRRGGSYDNYLASALRASNRHQDDGRFDRSTSGFRCALTLSR